MRFVVRMLGMASLAVAIIMAVSDATRSIAAGEWIATPLGQSWYSVSPDTLNLAQATVQRYLLPALWDPVIVFVLTLPGWAVFAVLALILHLIGLPRRHRKPASA
ncbi:hypothetical protein [Nitratireductor thuwali]|uniref:Uncharacterized protein n=1 Tax=Nitratireductor thuwali TaxID=2267699 RepID=A0ABY5MKW5_9HYPH|nr:hypothetical protein NTH_02183 [Nitratireductor thuwali]